jgi:hypothetical protein
MDDQLVDRPGHGPFKVPKEIWQGLLVDLTQLGTCLRRYDALARQVGWSCELAVAVNDVVESQAFALWCIVKGNICLLIIIC